SLRTVLPPVESNAVMVARRLSADGHALAAMGPQVGYYSPQIFSEYELHGGGIDSEGVTFPGASPYPLIGHGIDFGCSGTSANGQPAALTRAKAVNFHELSAVVPFMHLSENKPTDGRSFMSVMGQFPGSENWFYVDRRDVAWIQSGVYPKHVSHSDVELPCWV